MLIILLLGCIIIAWIAPGKKWPAAPTAAGSMVMALGIYMQGVWTYVSGQAPQSFLSRVLILGIVLVWLYLFASYVTSIRLATFYRDHLADPVKRFAVGTWVAGTATLLINLYSSFQIAWLQESIHIMATLNIALWLFYICYAIMGWYRLMIDTSSARVDGTVLLPAVATQSIALLCHQVFALSLGKGFTRSFIIVGLVCYVIGISIMIWRYYRSTTWNIEAWKITNCIVYGALAISGAAISLTEAWSGQVAYMLWWIVLLLVIVIESVEAAYAIRRIRQYGWRHGVGRYHTAQWTRLFTLGMFYFLTLHTLAPAANQSFTQILHHIVLVVGAWGITLLLIVELGLWLYRSMIGHRLLKEDGE